MALKGDLASVDLAQVFQMLSLNQKVGILSIESPRASRALHFDQRGATLFFDETVLYERVIQHAVRSGRVSELAVEDSRSHAERSGNRLIDSLLAGGFLTDEDLDDLIRMQLEEEIYDLFFWRSAHFEFYERATSLPSDTSQIDPRFYFAVDSLIMEAARRIDEWTFIQQRVQGPNEVYRAVRADHSRKAPTETEQAVYRLADGRRNIGRMVELTGLPRFHVFKAVAVLLEHGLLERVPDEDLWSAARECVTEERQQDAIDLYERAIECGAACLPIHAEVARVYETVGEHALAAAHLKAVAAGHAEAGEVSEAVRTLLHVVEMLPTDLAAREAMVDCTAGRPDISVDGFDRDAQGKALVDLYMEIGEVERTRGILERLLRDNPGDLQLKKRLINVHTKAGDTKRVVELYESIADDLIHHRDPIEAIKYLQKVVIIDRTRRDVSERIRQLYELDERRRLRRRALVALAVVLCVLSAVGAVWWVYEQRAREHMGVLEADVRRLTDEGHYAEAISRLDAFIASFPLTIVAQDAHGEKARIESLRDEHQAGVERDRRKTEAEKESLRQRYRLAWRVYQDQITSHELDAARETLRTVKELVLQAAAPADMAWAQEIGLERNREYLEDYIAKSLRLDREAWQKLEAGDWKGARDLWMTLTIDYEMSPLAKSVRIPVLLRTRPAGAEILVDGQPLTVEKDGVAVPQRTPAVLMCRRGRPESIELRLEGFQSAAIEVTHAASEVVDTTLRVIPRSVFEFTSPVQTAVGVGQGMLAVGLRGGRLGIGAIEGGEVRGEAQLTGLDEVDGRPLMTHDRCYFRSTEGYLVARRLPGGEEVWREKVAPMVHDPVLIGFRLVFADTGGHLHALDARTGKPVWSMPVGDDVVGSPVVEGGVVWLATRQGRILALDADTRSVYERIELKRGLVGPLVRSEVATICATEDGSVLAARGDRVLWEHALGRGTPVAGLALSGDSLVVCSAAKEIVRIRITDGAVQTRAQLGGPLVAGPVALGERVVVTLRRDGPKGEQFDVLQALDAATMELQWEFIDGGRFPAPPTSDGSTLFVPSSQGRVLRFR
jgi:outer membrane protein assembly factor BamB/tetratricopeptide (TPR) repeat protein